MFLFGNSTFAPLIVGASENSKPSGSAAAIFSKDFLLLL
jgi:hypothetical protein